MTPLIQFNSSWVNNYSEELNTGQKFICRFVVSQLKKYGYEINDVKSSDGSLYITIKHSKYCLDMDGGSVNEVLIKKGNTYEPMDRNPIEGTVQEVIKEICKRSFWKEGLDFKPYIVGFTEKERQQIIDSQYLRPWLRQMKKDGLDITPENLPF